MLSIQTNVNSMNAQENLRVTNQFQGRTIARLTSGYRINESGDDAAGLAVANKYRSDVAELAQGVRNANDGLSTLQIIDGGLSNVSKMLDRLKTLATQSASETFTGDRTTLNKEYQDLLVEINRQADMIGLGIGATGGRNNTDIDVYVGGKQQGTPKVTIELSGAPNRVDSAGLKLSGTTIAGGGATELTNNLKSIAGQTALLSGGATQSFTFNVKQDGSAAFSTTVTVTGSTSGITTDEAISQLNNSLGSLGIAASINSTSGELQFSGDTAFTVQTVLGAVASGLTTASATSSASNDSLFKVQGQTTYGGPITSGDDEVLTLTVGSKTSTVTLDEYDTLDTAITKLNAGFNGLGVSVLKNSGGTGVEFQSKAAFNIAWDGDTVAGDGVFSAADNNTDATQAVTSSATSAAEAAITAVQTAVSALGLVQGKVGTAQNKLSYAISLAQSQIVSFSAAESRIRDADVAQEAANLTKAQVLQQASLAALAQANSAPQAVLSLLRG